MKASYAAGPTAHVYVSNYRRNKSKLRSRKKVRNKGREQRTRRAIPAGENGLERKCSCRNKEELKTRSIARRARKLACKIL